MKSEDIFFLLESSDYDYQKFHGLFENAEDLFEAIKQVKPTLGKWTSLGYWVLVRNHFIDDNTQPEFVSVVDREHWNEQNRKTQKNKKGKST